MAYAVRRTVENVYLVRERDRVRTREFVALALAAVPPLLVLLAAIWANLETVRLGYQLATVGRQRETLLERNRQLRMERAQATSLVRVDAIARRTLGLVPPSPEQVLLIQDEALKKAPLQAPLGTPLLPAPGPAGPSPAARRSPKEGGF
jgi:cell division protein FtsL